MFGDGWVGVGVVVRNVFSTLFFKVALRDKICGETKRVNLSTVDTHENMESWRIQRYWVHLLENLYTRSMKS